MHPPSNEIIIVLTRLHSDGIKARYREKAHLLFKDTHSLMYHIETTNVYNYMGERKVHLDMSNFEHTNSSCEPLFAANKAEVEKMEDELAGNAMAEFVGIRPKMYSFEAAETTADGTTERYDNPRAKGIQRPAAERFLHEQYLDQLHNPTENYTLNR